MAKQKQLNTLGSLMNQAQTTLPEEPTQSAKEEQYARILARAAQAVHPQIEKGRVGRKKSNRTIARTNGITIFLEDSHRAILNRIGGLDKQDVIRTALDEFIKAYCTSDNITEKGRSIVENYIERTTDKPVEVEKW